MRTYARTGFVPKLEGLETRFLLDSGATLLITLNAQSSPNSWVNPIAKSSLIRTWDLVPGLGLYSLPDGVDAKSAMATISKNKSVVRVELNRAIDSQALFNDPLVSNQWSVSNTGQNGGLVGADTGAAQAQAIFSGTGNTIVAIIDSGIDYTHPELSSRMWVNPGEIPGNGIDDDKDGFVDDIYGANFVTGSGNPMDDNGHGTHVAGIIAATANNGQGIVGIDPKAKIMALKFLDANGNGTLSGAISALDYAVSKGARLSNNSWGGNELSPTLSDAIDRARLKGHIVVAAAGNDSVSDDSSPLYPASFAQDNIVSVGSSSNKDQLSWFSNYGKVSVDIVAPGDNILSTLPGNQYGLLSGTSMATPMVTGAIALLWDRRPDLPYTEILKALYGGVDKIASLTGKVVTGGRLDVAKSLAIIDKLPVDKAMPYVLSTSFAGDRTDRISSVRLEFSEPMDLASLVASVQLKGPTGAIIPVTLKAATGTISTVFTATFAEQTTLGTYTLTIAPKAKDTKGNLLDQGRNNIGGQANDGYTTTTTLAGSKNYASTLKTSIRDLKTVTSAIVVGDVLAAQRIQVSLNITHTDVSDLVVTLVSPWGQSFKLVDRNLTGTNIRDLVIEDFATSSLADGVAPYSGTYRPATPLGNLGGKSAKGTWTLSVTDQAVVDQGSLNSWSIKFLPEPAATVATATAKRLNGATFIKLQTSSGAGQVAAVSATVMKSIAADTTLADWSSEPAGLLGNGSHEYENGLMNRAIHEAVFVSKSNELFGGQLLAEESLVLVDRGAFLDDLFFAVGAGNVVVGTASSATAAYPATTAGAGKTATAKPLVAKEAELFAAAVIRRGPLHRDAAVADGGEGVVWLHDEPGFVGVEVSLGEETEGPASLSA